MKMTSTLIFISVVFLFSNLIQGQTHTVDFKKEILDIEKEFALMVREKGMEAGFLFYASEDAALNRGNKIIKGKSAIREYFQEQTLQNISLDWEVEYIDVSVSGDLAYTYGEYYFTATTPEGDLIEDVGIFHTVWKRNAKGKWKFVWD